MKRIGSAQRWITTLALALGVAACGDSPVTVLNPDVARIRIDPGTPVLTTLGDTLKLSVSVEDAKGNASSCTPTWTSDSPAIVTVSNRGTITAKDFGVALIIAACGTAADTARAEVVQDIHSVAISAQSVALSVGETKELWAVAHDAQGNPIPGVRFAWSSSDPAVASVDSTGVVTAVADGAATVTAAAGGKSAGATITVGGGTTPPPAGAGDFVVYPSAEIEFILGPQLKSGSAANPWPWFDENQITRAIVHSHAFPTDVGAVHITGTIGIDHTVSRRKVIGTGTRFTQELRAGQRIYIYNPDPRFDSYSAMAIASIESDTELTLAGDWWEGFSFNQGKVAHRPDHVNWDSYLNAQYYDLGLALYLTYYRTGDAQFLAAARKVVDTWWSSPVVFEGKISVTHAPAPRGVSLGGLMLRALDGRPELWDWITRYTRHQLDTWVMKRVTYDGLYYGVRDGGYMLLYGAWLAQVHPDATVRQEFGTHTLRAARDYYARLQHPDGAWYWQDSGNTWEQPFMVGLLLEGMIAVHKQSGDPVVRDAILRSVEHQWEFYRRHDPVPERPDVHWRSIPYFIRPDGSTTAEKNLAGGWDTNTIREGRQRNSLLVHAFGYAYHMTGDTQYRNWGDEVFASTYGKGSGPGADSFYGLADFREKEYNQGYRSAGRYLTWRLLVQ